jgi:hypothetical protein
VARRRWCHCCKQRAACRSCSCWSPIRSRPASSIAWRGRAVVTGFTSFEYSFGGKWLELLKEIAPSVTRAAVIRDPTDFAGIGVFGAVQTAASSVGVELSPVNVRDASEMERAIAAFARGSNGGLILTPGGLAFIHRDLIVTLAARHKLPAVYFSRPFVVAGGLASYGPDNLDQYRRAAAYVDRILKGEKPADLRPDGHRTQPEAGGACAIGATADGLSTSRECRCGRPLVVWTGLKQPVPPSELLCRSHPQG